MFAGKGFPRKVKTYRSRKSQICFGINAISYEIPSDAHKRNVNPSGNVCVEAYEDLLNVNHPMKPNNEQQTWKSLCFT